MYTYAPPTHTHTYVCMKSKFNKIYVKSKYYKQKLFMLNNSVHLNS